MFFRSGLKAWKLGKGWKTWGASVIGSCHVSVGLPNQDSFTFGSSGFGRNRVIFAAVADGLGSKTFSHFGSRAFCKAVKKLASFYRKNQNVRPCDLAVFCQGIWSDIVLKSWCKYGNEKNHKSSDLLKLSDFSTTGLFIFLYKNSLVTFKIGDGCILGLYNDDKYFVLKEEKEDSFANITSCLGTSMKLQDWQVGITDCNGLEGVMLCTDGISTDIDCNEADFCRGLMNEYKDKSPDQCIEDAKKWIREWPVKGNGDDKTIVMITKN